MRSDRSVPDPVIELFQDTLDRPIAFHPVFVDLTGSITAGLLLSQAVYWTRRITRGDWFYKTMMQWEEETKLSRHEQENARKILRQFSFWQEERRGVPAQMYFRIDIAVLYKELLALKAGNRSQSRLPESGKLECRKAANRNAGKQQSGLPKTGNLYKGISEITPEITPKTTSKTSTNTPLPPAKESPGTPVRRPFIEKFLLGTIFKNADARRITQAARQYKRNVEEVQVAIDVLSDQYRQSTRSIDDPTALMVSVLKKGILLPEGFTLIRPYQECEEA